jgi:hypothetical protein
MLDAVAAGDVSLELVESVGQTTSGGPQVMMWVNDPLRGIDHVFVNLFVPLWCLRFGHATVL